MSCGCLNCLIKKGNDFTNSLFSVHDQGEISDDTRDNFETALDLCVSCSYYSLSDITATFEQHCNDSLSIIHVNNVSLSRNLYKLENFLTQVRYAPDIIAITETANLRCLHIAVCCLPPNSYSLLKQEFTDSLSTVLTSLLVNPDRCVLIIGDCNDHSAIKKCQLQSNLLRTYHHLTINNYCYDC